MKILTFFSIFLLWQNLIFAMSKPKPGVSVSSVEFGLRSQMTAQNAPWMDGYRLGFNASPFFVSIEHGFVGDSPATSYFGFTLGVGSGPLNNSPTIYKLQPYGKINLFSPKWRDGQFITYYGVELGLSGRLIETWGWFVSAGIEYPGILLAPRELSQQKEEIRNRDGLATFLNIGLAYGSSPIE